MLNDYEVIEKLKEVTDLAEKSGGVTYEEWLRLRKWLEEEQERHL